MTNFTIEIAHIPIGASVLYDSTRQYCSRYLTDRAPEFTVATTPEDIARERQIAAREDAREGKPVRTLTDALLEVTALQRKLTEQLLTRDVLLLHGSAIAVDGVAYLFTARSGTGKSTHTRLWRQLLGGRAVMVNDDKPYLHITDRGVQVCGSPWNGKHGMGTNLSVPLKAICILERGAENRICRIPAKDALFMLLQQSSRPAQGALLPKYMELLDTLSQKVSFYRLQCTISPEAAQLAFQTMSTPK